VCLGFTTRECFGTCPVKTLILFCQQRRVSTWWFGHKEMQIAVKFVLLLAANILSGGQDDNTICVFSCLNLLYRSVKCSDQTSSRQHLRVKIVENKTISIVLLPTKTLCSKACCNHFQFSIDSILGNKSSHDSPNATRLVRFVHLRGMCREKVASNERLYSCRQVVRWWL